MRVSGAGPPCAGAKSRPRCGK